MKKNVYVLIMFVLGMNIIQAKSVTPETAKNVAVSFYKQHTAKLPNVLTLAYTETSATGEALYYVFNVNTNDGFVIVTADDAAHPIIGYSTERQFVIPDAKMPIGYWMKKRKEEIISIKAANLTASADIKREWTGDFSANKNTQARTSGLNSVLTTSVAPLVQSTWNQSPYYNKLCPGTGSNQAVTGCVATTMAQIMRYWSYPAHGTGSSSYCDCTAGGYSVQNGTLTANYATTTYSWTSMPLPDASVTSSNCTAIATLMYQAGVSVDMDYSPSGSGAQVLAVDAGGGPCAQTSYTAHFGYDPTTIKGYQRTQGGYTDNAWLTLIETDLNAGRPVQYAGQDPSQGGHTWVCDGYDVSNNVHMNWGWGGYDDGYFSINNLLTTNGSPGFNPSTDHEILVGIQPPPSVDAGVSAISAPAGVVCTATFTPQVTIKNFGVNTLTSCKINYQLDAGTVQTYTWTGSLATGSTGTVSLPAVTAATGSHTLTATSSNPNNTTDANTSNDQTIVTFISSTIGGALPLMEGFEGSTSLPSGWSINNPDGDAAWNVVTTVAHTGSNCIGFDNCDGDGTTDMTGKKDWFYTSTYNLSSGSSSMSFDVAYTDLLDAGVSYTDTLVVLYSLDCGATWNQLYRKGGATLATAPTFTTTASCWSPTSTQWRTETINLSALSGHSNVEFAFENISDWAEWIYLDNINITTNATTGIGSAANNSGIVVYPNPAHNLINISVAENTGSFSVTDIIGQTVVAEQKVKDTQQLQTIDISNLADGIYFIKVISTDNNAKVIRFIKN